MKRRALRAGLAVCVTAIGAGAAGTAQAATSPCGTLKKSAVNYTHVMWILMENHSYGTIIGNPDAPYINKVANECGLATNYHNISHPSLPNYVGMTSGLPIPGLSQFVSDCNPSVTCSTPSQSIFSQTPSWKAYEESMPSNCYRKDFGEYAVRHNPVPYFSDLTGCKTKDVPYTQLAGDLAHGNLPAFSFITPNVINDMHDGTVAQGDAWLKANVPPILDSSYYQSGNLVVVIVWDEGENGTSNSCATNTIDIGCHVPALVISPSTIPGTKSASLFNHYSLLGSTERLLGLPLLRMASTAGSMLKPFGL